MRSENSDPEAALEHGLAALQILGAHHLHLQRWGRDSESVIARSEARARRQNASEDPGRLFGGEEGEAHRPESSEGHRNETLLLAAGVYTATAATGSEVPLDAAIRRRVLDASTRQHAVSRRSDFKASKSKTMKMKRDNG